MLGSPQTREMQVAVKSCGGSRPEVVGCVGGRGSRSSSLLGSTVELPGRATKLDVSCATVASQGAAIGQGSHGEVQQGRRKVTGDGSLLTDNGWSGLRQWPGGTT